MKLFTRIDGDPLSRRVWAKSSALRTTAWLGELRERPGSRFHVKWTRSPASGLAMASWRLSRRRARWTRVVEPLFSGARAPLYLAAAPGTRSDRPKYLPR